MPPPSAAFGSFPMTYPPQFPAFKPVELSDRDFIQSRFWAYQPTTSELTFTNLFIWRKHYRLSWSLAADCLVFLSDSSQDPWLFPPVGPSPGGDLCRTLLTWLKEERHAPTPRMERVDRRVWEEVADTRDFVAEPLRDHFDYVYSTSDLIGLAGRNFHQKRNHLNSFQRAYRHTYEPLRPEHLMACLDLAEKWCEIRRCAEDLNLMDEWEAVREALAHFADLGLTGGALFVEDRLEAFTVGERLNADTAVIHLEKANPEIRGLYAAINQAFLERSWQEIIWVNREQDLGEPGLRQAKLSYHPHHLEEKFTLRLA
jgi:hypothetical protein